MKNFKNKYIVFLVMVALIVLELFSSYAIFVTKQLQENVVSVKIDETLLSLKINNIENREINVNANSDNYFNLEINNKSIDLYYEIFFKSNKSGLLVTSIEKTKGYIKSNEVISTRVHVINKSSIDIKINFLVKGSLQEEVTRDVGYSYINDKENFDHSHANIPLMNNMNLIPVSYQSTSEKDGYWYKADINNKDSIWYDYDHFLWANAVLVSNSNYQKYLNSPINAEIQYGDILGFYVWIPRYKYTIMNNSNYTNFEKINNVIFEKGNATTGSIICHDKISNLSDEHIYSEVCEDKLYGKIYDNLSTYTHPAFKDKTGFWVSKFLMSDGYNTIRSLPNMNYLKKNVNEAFNLSSRVNNKSHLLTNMEYGSIIILTDSFYGKSNNSDYLDDSYTFKRVYTNNYVNDITGCSSDYNNYSKTFITDESKTCIKYNDLTNYSHVNNSVKYNIYQIGPGASSTGTINGVYDLANIPGELVSAFTANKNGEMNVYTSYLDKYSYNDYLGKIISSNSIENINRYKLGDAIKENFRLVRDNGMWQGGLLEQKSLDGVFLRGGNGDVKNSSIYTTSIVSLDTKAPFRIAFN